MVLRKIWQWIKSFFVKEKENSHIGYWGIVDSDNPDNSMICGEMYNCNGVWLPGPKLYEKRGTTIDELYENA